MNKTFMDLKYGKTSDSHKLMLNLSDKINLKSSDNRVDSSTLSFYYTWKNIKIAIQKQQI